MSPIETVIVYSIAIAMLYVLIIWFLHKASVYFKKLNDKINKTLMEMPGEETSPHTDVNESISLRTKETVEHSKKQEHISTPKEIAANK
jgi:hypothetical protein